MIALAQQSNILDFPSVAPQGKSNEWYTPARYIEAARQVMGSIDLDPASCEMANRTVKAKRYYTQAENGLAQEWYGNVWLNPPYSSVENSKGNQEVWSTHLMQQYARGKIQQAILMVQAKPGYLWFHDLWEYPICLTKGRVRFYTPSGERGLAVLGSAFVYLGLHEQKFIEVFSQFGRVVKAVDTPRIKLFNLGLWQALDVAKDDTEQGEETV